MTRIARPTTEAAVADRDERRLRELDRRQRQASTQLTERLGQLTNLPAYAAQQSIVQDVPNATWTTLRLDAVAVDTHGAARRDAFVAPRAGLFLLSGVVILVGSNTGKRAVGLAINGARLRAGTAIAAAATGDGDPTVPTPTRLVPLAAGDAVSLQVFHNAGAVLSTYVSSDTCSGLDVVCVQLIDAGMPDPPL